MPDSNQTVAIVSIVAGSAVGLTGLIVTGLSGRSEREQRQKLAVRQDRAHAYVELLTMTTRIGEWAQRVRPILDTEPPQPLPQVPSGGEQAVVMAKVAAHGSPAVKKALKAWRDAFDAVRLSSLTVGHRLTYVDGKDPYVEWEKLADVLKPKEDEERQNLADVIASELA